MLLDFIVEVRGGLVVGVYARDTAARVAVVDWDHLDCSADTDSQAKDCLDLSAPDSLEELSPDARRLIEHVAAGP